MKTRHKSPIGPALLCLLLCASLLLCGCDGETETPPTEYRIGEDHLPSLTAAVPMDDGMRFSEITDEDGETAYQYTGLSSGQAVVSEYVETMTDAYDCHVLLEDGQIVPDPDLTAESGETVLGIASNTGTGTFLLRFQWDAASCTVTPSYQEGETVHAELITVEEAVELLEGMDPSELSLERDAAFEIYPEEGVVMVDESPCFCLNAYWADTHQIAGTYLVSADGSTVYRLDRETGQASVIAG